MKRALVLSAPLFLLVACQSQSLTTTPPNTSLLPALTVNDGCSSHTTSVDCQGDTTNSCSWMNVDACPAGVACPAAVCVTTNACANLTDQKSCVADARCAWSAIEATASSPALCPVGQDCGGGGFCFERGSTGSGCICVQPLVCPANGACPPVQCDCPPPAPSDAGAGGGGTCTCGCPACAPGASCPACDCTCGTGGTGGSGGTGGGGSGGTGGCGGDLGGGGTTGTCTCNCPTCPAGAACAACSCACSNGATTTMTLAPTTTGGGSTGGTTGGTTGGSPTPTTSGSPPVAVCACPACPAGAACAPCDCAVPPPPDPCTGYTDAASCTADTKDACGWTSLQIECITTPCPTGSCTQKQPVPDAGSGSGGGGCGCACPACAPGETCPPCACSCCGAPPPVLTPVVQGPSQGGAGAAD